MITKTWVEIEAGLGTLFARLSGLPKASPASAASPLPTAAVGSRDGEFKFPSVVKQASIDFAVVSVVPVGIDEKRPRFDPAAVIAGDTSGPGGTPQTGGVVYDVVGNRRWVIEVAIECFDQKKGLDYARAVHDRLSLPSSRAELSALGLALSSTGDMQDASYEDETGRAVALFVFEITCNGCMVVTDEAITTIETVETEVTVN
jgi:hypothetical protein